MSIVNLLPDDYVEQQRHSRANRMCLVLFLVVMAGVITAAVVSERSGRHTQEILDRFAGLKWKIVSVSVLPNYRPQSVRDIGAAAQTGPFDQHETRDQQK